MGMFGTFINSVRCRLKDRLSLIAGKSLRDVLIIVLSSYNIVVERIPELMALGRKTMIIDFSNVECSCSDDWLRFISECLNMASHCGGSIAFIGLDDDKIMEMNLTNIRSYIYMFDSVDSAIDFLQTTNEHTADIRSTTCPSCGKFIDIRKAPIRLKCDRCKKIFMTDVYGKSFVI